MGWRVRRWAPLRAWGVPGRARGCGVGGSQAALQPLLSGDAFRASSPFRSPSPGFRAAGSITAPSPTFPDSARPSFPRAGTQPPGKTSTSRLARSKISPAPPRMPLPRWGAEPALPLCRNLSPRSAVGRLGAERRAPALSKIEAEQMVGAGCWWQRQPSLFPRQLLPPSIRSPELAFYGGGGVGVGGGEASICVLGRCWAHQGFLGVSGIPPHFGFWYFN